MGTPDKTLMVVTFNPAISERMALQLADTELGSQYKVIGVRTAAEARARMKEVLPDTLISNVGSIGTPTEIHAMFEEARTNGVRQILAMNGGQISDKELHELKVDSLEMPSTKESLVAALLRSITGT